MQILVTGSTGFLGSHLVKTLLEKDEVTRVFGVNRKIGLTPESLSRAKPDGKLLNIYTCLDNEAYVESLFRFVKPDIIFHLACGQGKSSEAFQENVSITNFVLKHCPKGIRFVMVSSSTVYGDLANTLTVWDHHSDANVLTKCYEDDITIPTNLYGLSKLTSEGLVSLAGKLSSYVILRPCSIIGPDANHGLLPDLIRKTKSDELTLKLFGPEPGSQKPFLHIDDCVKGLLHFGLNKELNGVYNLSAKTEMSVLEVANLVMKELKVVKPIEWIDNPIVGDNRLVALDNGKALKTGFQLKFPTSQDAILEVLKHF